ncbi:MAG: hypothetical protein NXH97_05880 [Rhodobacteraceae bacterium]|nr:hypothetical protein [Paracoccaceae bacterium]
MAVTPPLEFQQPRGGATGKMEGKKAAKVGSNAGSYAKILLAPPLGGIWQVNSRLYIPDLTSKKIRAVKNCKRMTLILDLLQQVLAKC